MFLLCAVNKASNVCAIFVVWLFSIDYDVCVWRGLNSSWGCNIVGGDNLGVFMSITIVGTSHEIESMPILC
jgi:hypothetical protein